MSSLEDDVGVVATDRSAAVEAMVRTQIDAFVAAGISILDLELVMQEEWHDTIFRLRYWVRRRQEPDPT